MKLYEGWRSSASWRVRWALAIKKIAYESVLVDVEVGEQHTLLAPKNPMHQVPTLELDDGDLLTESVAIIEWLDETHADPPLLPKEPRAGRFSVGDEISMADLYLVPQVRNAERHDVDISACPRVLAIYDACMALPEARATDPEVVKKRAQ